MIRWTVLCEGVLHTLIGNPSKMAKPRLALPIKLCIVTGDRFKVHVFCYTVLYKYGNNRMCI